jgi:hypothetical protein
MDGFLPFVPILTNPRRMGQLQTLNTWWRKQNTGSGYKVVDIQWVIDSGRYTVADPDIQQQIHSGRYSGGYKAADPDTQLLIHNRDGQSRYTAVDI